MIRLIPFFIRIIIFALVISCQSTFAQTENIILGRPTDSAITASVLFDQSALFYIEYGQQSGVYTSNTSVVTAYANVPFEIDITGLQPNTRYYYRLKSHLLSSSSFNSGPEHSFHTQRAKGSSFCFTLEADEHLYDIKGVESLYKICLNNQAKDQPDFMMSLGDIFGDDHFPLSITNSQLDLLHKNYRPLIGSIAHSIPFYVCLGNHEGENDYYMAITPPNNLAIMATQWRKYYYPNPYPNQFYTGNTDKEPYGIGYPENYYAWTWGDAQFIVLDVYRDECDTSAKPVNWEWSLGKPQYDWLKSTLEGSTSKFKFVFAHHIRGQGRGGITNAKLFEWGGYDGKNGTNYNFPNKRPGWAKPIHQLFKDNGVNIFFQGHDHVFAHEILDGITYQALPMPSDSTYSLGKIANASAYTSDTLDGSGHLKVTVTSDCVKVDYIRAYLPSDTLNSQHKNGEIAFSYTIGTCSTTKLESEENDANFSIYPNPANQSIHIELPNKPESYYIHILQCNGQKVVSSVQNDIQIDQLNDGLYFVEVRTETSYCIRKLIIHHQ